jgi:hypothetical protein
MVKAIAQAHPGHYPPIRHRQAAQMFEVFFASGQLQRPVQPRFFSPRKDTMADIPHLTCGDANPGSRTIVYRHSALFRGVYQLFPIHRGRTDDRPGREPYRVCSLCLNPIRRYQRVVVRNGRRVHLPAPLNRLEPIGTAGLSPLNSPCGHQTPIPCCSNQFSTGGDSRADVPMGF